MDYCSNLFSLLSCLYVAETYIHMNVARNVYGYGRGGEYVYMLRYTHAGTREINLQMEEEHRYKSRVMHTSIGTVT